MYDEHYDRIYLKDYNILCDSVMFNLFRPEETAEFFDEDGFGSIGDVGHYDEVLYGIYSKSTFKLLLFRHNWT